MTNERSYLNDFVKYINERTLEENGFYYNNKIYEVDANSVGQLIGQDIDGKDLYDNDIVEIGFMNCSTQVAFIKFDDITYYLVSVNGEEYSIDREIQIIGNRYENSILLSKENKNEI